MTKIDIYSNHKSEIPETLSKNNRFLRIPDNIMRLKGLIFAFMFLFIFSPSYSAAEDISILQRLEKIEKELRQLKKENAELRRKINEQENAKATEDADIKKMLATNKEEIEDLKKSSGKQEGSGLKAALSKYDLQLYGRVKFDVNYDTAEFRNYNDFLGVVGAGDASNDSTNFNPRDTRFGFKAAHKEGRLLAEARMEMDFYGSNSGNNLIPRMRLGYVKLTDDKWDANLLLGQDWTPVASLNPSMIDFGIMAAAGNIWWRVPQVTLRKKAGNVEYLVSLMKHKRLSTAEEDRMPWTLAKVSYTNGLLGKGGYMALGGGWKSETLSENTYGIDNKVDRWLLALELKKKFGKFTILAEPWIGDGLDKEWLRYDMGVNTYDAAAYMGKRPDTIFSRGGFASLIYNWNSKQTFSAGYSIDDPRNSDMKGMTLSDRQFTRNEMFYFNTWYSLTKALKMGGEIIYLETERSSDMNNGMRYTFSSMYSF